MMTTAEAAAAGTSPASFRKAMTLERRRGRDYRQPRDLQALPRQAGLVTSRKESAMKITDEMLVLGARALDVPEWPGWGFEDVARAAIEAAAPLIAAKALLDAADALDDDAWESAEGEYRDGIECAGAFVRRRAEPLAATAPDPLTPDDRAALHGLVGLGSRRDLLMSPLLLSELAGLLDAASERDRLAAIVERVERVARGPVRGMDRRLRWALDGAGVESA